MKPYQLVIILGLATLLIFGLAGVYLIENFQQEDFIEVLLSGRSIPLQLLIGAIYGLVSSGIALLVISRDFFKKEKLFYQKKISALNLNYPGIIFISLCAGIGEEIFFRAALQPFLGIWLTSVVFVFLHGYLNPFNWRIFTYGLTMTMIIAGIGYLFEYTGLITAMTAHAVLDIVLLIKFKMEKIGHKDEL